MYNNIKKKELERIGYILSNLYQKISSLRIFLVFLIIIFTMFYITNDSYSVESQNAIENVFNIITISDVGCSLRAQENIKNIEKLQRVISCSRRP